MKTSASYKLDSFLMHLIQDITKKPSIEILSFFYELTNEVIRIGIESRKHEYSSIYKKIFDYFPNTSVPFCLIVKGSPNNYWGTKENKFHSYVEIKFPEKASYMEEAKLAAIESALMEQVLLGGKVNHIANFEKPEIKVPKMYKTLMDTIAGRPVKEQKRRKKKSDPTN